MRTTFISELRKVNTNSAYFLTFTIVVFTRKELAESSTENLKKVQIQHHLVIYSYVIMSSHLHLIAQKKVLELLSKWIRDSKSAIAMEIVKEIRTLNYES